MYVALTHAMRKHGKWNNEKGGDLIGGCMVSFFLIAFVRIPVYLYLYGWVFPFNPSPTVSLLTGVGAIAFWWAMLWWQVPARLLGRSTTPSKTPAQHGKRNT